MLPEGQAPPAMVGRSPRELGLSPAALHAGWGPRSAPWTLLSLHFLPIPSSRLGTAISEVGTTWPEGRGPYPLGPGRLVGMETCREGRVATWPLSFSDSCVPFSFWGAHLTPQIPSQPLAQAMEIRPKDPNLATVTVVPSNG